ncbi:hypothetical protein NECAME_08673 [Necator americanus]|uniref:Uncharacterized protein n=1 Tax=Necator americanus TaxID=51031 RepID=W2THD6_NECAM|nr:hypothetical protein NECAME_08673 [Necator americanus]ETN81233.1 hypothetical protein NECAME_08673 [Necator americanus]
MITGHFYVRITRNEVQFIVLSTTADTGDVFEKTQLAINFTKSSPRYIALFGTNMQHCPVFISGLLLLSHELHTPCLLQLHSAHKKRTGAGTNRYVSLGQRGLAFLLKLDFSFFCIPIDLVDEKKTLVGGASVSAHQNH